jgi:hypothetical protein
MIRPVHHRASLMLALFAALLQALAMPLAHGRLASGPSDICTAQGLRSASSETPDLPGASPRHDHCALCLHPPSAGAPAALPFAGASRRAFDPQLPARDPCRLALRFALRDARAPPPVRSS